MFFKRSFFHEEYRNTFLFLSFFVIVSVGAFALYCNIFILSKYAPQIETLESLNSTTSVAIVFGGGMESELQMSRMQEDRMTMATRLYKEEKVQKLILTGDDGANRFDEVSAMYVYAIDAGVSPQDIVLDWYGYRTYDSCYRAKYVYDVDYAFVVSQSFHLPRISYLCESFGIQNVPISADQGVYDGWWTPRVREALARIKAVLQSEFTHPVPRRLMP